MACLLSSTSLMRISISCLEKPDMSTLSRRKPSKITNRSHVRLHLEHSSEWKSKHFASNMSLPFGLRVLRAHLQQCDLCANKNFIIVWWWWVEWKLNLIYFSSPIICRPWIISTQITLPRECHPQLWKTWKMAGLAKIIFSREVSEVAEGCLMSVAVKLLNTSTENPFYTYVYMCVEIWASFFWFFLQKLKSHIFQYSCGWKWSTAAANFGPLFMLTSAPNNCAPKKNHPSHE